MFNLTNIALSTLVVGAVYTSSDNNIANFSPQQPMENFISQKAQANLPDGMFSCQRAISKMWSNDYVEIKILDCVGSQYRFKASKRGSNYVVIFASFSGSMVAISDPAKQPDKSRIASN